MRRLGRCDESAILSFPTIMKRLLQWLKSEPKVNDLFGFNIRSTFQSFLKLKKEQSETIVRCRLPNGKILNVHCIDLRVGKK